MLQPALQAAVQRGVRVYVITKDLRERKSLSDDYRYLEQTLRSWGVVVVHKRGMHEKLVFIDDDVLWLGSLNPLSHSDTQEIMERRASPTVVEDFARTLRLGELIAEFRDGIPTCPSGHELIAAEGDKDPFYWRCTYDGCYSRDVDEPRPVDGMIWCSNPACGGAVEYGEWGSKPAWRCIEDRHHHRKVMPSHLRLPKMRELIPKRELGKLDRVFGIQRAAGPESCDGQSELGLDPH